MRRLQPCPICGKLNEQTYFTEAVGLCEDYYFCSNCGYFVHMCYSEPLIGFTIPNGKTELEILKKFGEKILEKNLKFIPPDQLP